MSDETAIPPALTAEEWRRANVHSRARDDGRSIMAQDAWRDGRREAVMALANHALPDDSPYKITWAMVDAIRRTTYCLEAEGGDCRTAFAAADVLAAYLPPRSTPA